MIMESGAPSGPFAFNLGFVEPAFLRAGEGRGQGGT